MQTVLKALLAILLALGCLVLDAKAKPSVAFLGLGQDADPLFHEELTQRIQRDLSADTGVFNLPASEIAPLFSRGILTVPEVGPFDLPRLSSLGAQYYAFGWLEPLAVETARKWTKFWDVKVRWTQGLRLRVVEAATGMIVFDGVVPAEIAEKSFVWGPEKPGSRMSPTDRDRCYRRMLPVLSSECARTLAKVVTERAAGQRSAAVEPPK
jgi:hypothetical protein